MYNWETNSLVRAFSKRLGISRRGISFAGNKDKRAITIQLFSFDAKPRAILNSNLKDVYILDYYRSDDRIRTGELYGNRFEITIREIPHKKEKTLQIVNDFKEELTRMGGFPNFFGVQRFGAIRPVTHIVGKNILEGRYEDAVSVFLSKSYRYEPEIDRYSRELLAKDADLNEALKVFPQYLTFERSMIQYLINHPKDYIGSLKVLPQNLFKLFIHAYQSYLFNRILSARIKRNIPLSEALVGDIIIPLKDELPDRGRMIKVKEENLDIVNRKIKEGKAYVTALLPGVDPIFSEGEMGEIERSILEEEGTDSRIFRIPEFPRIKIRSIRRECHAIPFDLSYFIPLREDTLKVSFYLFRGTYATSFLRELMKAPILNY